MGTFKPASYDLASHEDLGSYWDRAAEHGGALYVEAPAKAALFNLRMQLYRYRKAFEAQTEDTSYSNLELTLEPNGSAWRLVFKPKKRAFELRDVVTHAVVE